MEEFIIPGKTRLNQQTDTVKIHGDIGALDQVNLTNSNPVTVAVVDGNGDQITSFGGGTQYVDGAVRGTATGTLSMGDDGTNIQSIKVDSTGELQVDVLTLPAITGSVTANAGTNLNTSALNLEATQTAMSAKLPTTLGQKTMANSMAVVLASDQSSIPVTGTFYQATQPVSLATNTPTLQANSGVDIGDVTINNASGASAVNIQDGGNTITVDGTVSANATLSAETTKVIGVVRTADGSGNLLTSTTNALDVNLKTSTITLPVSLTSTTVTGTVATKEVRSATPAQTSPSVGVASTSILASNANRLGATIFNEGTAICYMKLGGTASVTSYSLQIASGGYYEVPFGYTGAIDGITSASTAQLRVTELTT